MTTADGPRRWRRQLPHRPDLAIRYGAQHWRACLAGDEPAESLSTEARETLVALLVEAGWSDVQVAVHCRMTLYTTTRIRDRMRWVARLREVAELEAAS